ncbi:MAG: tRNA lysidine(34) synthetase TilS [Oscillatoriales cyanobacterium C42_A2020_001]|nr:tRNA lysidine(34) synthetase TilS [Leptolyngbyaceae cyanobacterium C42_A2020_001]
MTTSWTPFHARLHQTLKARRLLAPGQAVLMAVSGGQDSLCLAKLLLDLQPKWHWKLAIAHCDHLWRADSADNAAHVHQLAQNWQLPYFQQTAEAIPTSEAAAREWRYACLTQLGEQANYDCIVTGHTASDRAETLLFNLIRGSGSDGLQALTWQRALTPTIKLVRPLLEVTRAQTAQFCQDYGITVWEDSTNQELTYARNRLRLEVFPYLATHLNPQVELALAQTAELLQAEVEFLEQEATALYQAIANKQDPSRFHRHILRQAPVALQRRVIRQFLQAKLQTAPNFDQIEKIVALLTAPNRSQTDPFPGGAIAQVDGDWVYFL